MKTPILIASFTLLWCSAGARAQTSVDLDKKYHPITAYEVRPGIFMTAEYATDGQVCRMTLEPRRTSKDAINLDVLVDDDLVDAFVDEIAPPGTRGKPGKYDGLTLMLGQPAITIKDYEYVTIRRYGNVRNIRGKQYLEPWVVTLTWNKRTCPS
ncbi:MAG TPA: hypothetical protein VE863_06945 [Pyrinomonadaceae bacterium]|nr:hypothetical protein [Pyrinomonadaceae bacterium]